MDKKDKLSSIKKKITLRPGDIVWTDNVNFAYDKSGEPKYNNIKEQKKPRPFIVLSAEKHNEAQITVSGVFGTGEIDSVDTNDPFTIKLDASQETGLTKETYFDITQIQPVHIKTIKNKSGRIDDSELQQIYYLMLKYYGYINDENNDENK
jgi:mRNA-degrading endonuclease toxin of MazEF toxin-antitoxin module